MCFVKYEIRRQYDHWGTERAHRLMENKITNPILTKKQLKSIDYKYVIVKKRYFFIDSLTTFITFIAANITITILISIGILVFAILNYYN